MINSSFMQKKTVEELIKGSVEATKLLNQKKRRGWVRRMLDYYGGNGTNRAWATIALKGV